jgi:hypothetical protein
METKSLLRTHGTLSVLASDSWAWGLPWSIVDVPSYNLLEKTGSHFAGGCQLQTASWLGTRSCSYSVSWPLQLHPLLLITSSVETHQLTPSCVLWVSHFVFYPPTAACWEPFQINVTGLWGDGFTLEITCLDLYEGNVFSSTNALIHFMGPGVVPDKEFM